MSSSLLGRLRPLRNVAMAAAERLWRASFGLAGKLSARIASSWSSGGGLRVLTIAPHPDDEAIGCAGTLLRHKAWGDQLFIAYVTDGRASRAMGLAPEQMAARRHQEAEAGARALGADRVDWLGLPEGQWDIEQSRSFLADLVEELAPQLVYAPSRVDFHPEHRRVAQALALALLDLRTASRARVRVRAYQIQVPLTSLLANVVVDVSNVAEEIGAVLAMYDTQRDNMSRALRQRRYTAAFHGMGAQAEEFWELSAEQYIELHAAATPSSPDTFRGVRWHPWTDPAAYLLGRAHRHQLGARVRQG